MVRHTVWQAKEVLDRIYARMELFESRLASVVLSRDDIKGEGVLLVTMINEVYDDLARLRSLLDQLDHGDP